jgi:hypothetical protein
MHKFCIVLLRHLKKKYEYPEYEGLYEWTITKRLLLNYNPDNLIENIPTGPNDTSYVKNKGSEFGMCLREQNSGDYNLFKLNEIKYVIIHELTHLASTDYGHAEQFWINFKFLLEEAMETKLYNPINYELNPIDYCGLQVTYNPIFDETLVSHRVI